MTKSAPRALLLLSFLAAGCSRTLAGAAGTAPARPGQGLSQAETVDLPVRIVDFSSAPQPLTVIFRFTPLVTGAGGRADIQPWKTAWKLRGVFSNLPPASRLGAQCLTYVLWSVSSEGRTSNLGEITLDGTEGQISTKINTLHFGLIVTAEPYFAVSQPSNAVALQADAAPGAAATIPVSRSVCKLLTTPIGADTAATRSPPADDPAGPLLVEEGRRAIAAARLAGAEQYAPETLHTAEQLLRLAHDQQAAGAPKKDVTDTGKEVVLIAEDARVLAVTRRAREPRVKADSSP